VSRDTALPAWRRQVTCLPLPDAHWLLRDDAVITDWGVPGLHGSDDTALARLAGNAPWPDCVPTASGYGGHQFGRWVEQLGDGRVATVAVSASGAVRPWALQLKGAGPTPFARGADGRATLRASLREYLACSAMQSLGVPTTQAVSLVGADLHVLREEHTEPAAVLARIAPHFLRFGHLQQRAAVGDLSGVRTLADEAIAIDHPTLATHTDRHGLWLEAVVDRTAELIAHWQTLGFCHGVMNTDNFHLGGLTLDYGPYAFMDRFRAHHVCNASDHEGRYAYSAQPAVGVWNCERLAEACAPAFGLSAEALADTLGPRFRAHYAQVVMQRWRAKLGLLTPDDGDAALLNRFLSLLQRHRRDFTLAFRQLALLGNVQMDDSVQDENGSPVAPALLGETVATDWQAWISDWQARLRREGQQGASADTARRHQMQAVNPALVLRNHLAQRTIDAALRGDMTPAKSFLSALSNPYVDRPDDDIWAQPPGADEADIEVSCAA